MKIIMAIGLTTLYLFSKKLFLLMLFIILLPIDTFSMHHLTQQNYCTFLKDQSIYKTIDAIQKYQFDKPNALLQKDVILELLKTFFTELHTIINSIPNKQDAWMLFLTPDVALNIPWAYYLTHYYQTDMNFTTLFVNSINNLFDSIEDENDKQNAQICSFFAICRYTGYSDTIFVLWDEKDHNAFLYVPKKLSEDTLSNNSSSWYNILHQRHNTTEHRSPPETLDVTDHIKKASYFYYTLEDDPFFTYSKISDTVLVITEHTLYNNMRIMSSPSNLVINNKKSIGSNTPNHYLKTYSGYAILVIIFFIIGLCQAKILYS